jgi:hypothetical protein
MVRSLAAIALAAVVTLTGIAIGVRPWRHSPPAAAAAPAVLAAAVAGYRDSRMLGTAVAGEGAPDLTRLGLRLHGAAAGRLGGMPVTTFSYLTSAGALLVIYRSNLPFPEATEAHVLGGEDGAWTLRSRGVTVICARGAHTMLLLGSDAVLVKRASAALHAT